MWLEWVAGDASMLGRMQGRGSCGAQRVGMSILLGGNKAWPARGVRRWLFALRRDAVAKVIAKATEKSSWSLKWEEGLGAADIANRSIKSTKTGCRYPERLKASC